MNWKIWIDRLNNISKFVNFEFIHGDLSAEYVFEADYFGSTLQIKVIDPLRKTQSLKSCFLTIENENGKIVSHHLLEAQRPGKLISNLKAVIGEHVRSRKFTIVKYKRGMYQLLAPGGGDYIGQYVTLKDAKRTSGYNYVL